MNKKGVGRGEPCSRPRSRSELDHDIPARDDFRTMSGPFMQLCISHVVSLADSWVSPPHRHVLLSGVVTLAGCGTECIRDSIVIVLRDLMFHCAITDGLCVLQTNYCRIT